MTDQADKKPETAKEEDPKTTQAVETKDEKEDVPAAPETQEGEKKEGETPEAAKTEPEYNFTEEDLERTRTGYVYKNKGLLAYPRAVLRMGAFFGLLGVSLLLTPLQAFVVGPVFRNTTTIPRTINRLSSWIFNVKMERTGKDIEANRITWFIPNHMSTADVWVGRFFNAAFVMKGDILKWPVVNTVARAAKFIGVYRSGSIRKIINGEAAPETEEEKKASKEKAERKFAENIGTIIGNFNRGDNLGMFAEGTTTPGDRVLRFSAGFLSALYNAKGVDHKGNEVKLEKDVVVQPLAMRVKSVDGEDVSNDRKAWEAYTMHNDDNMLKRIWKRAMVREIVLEVHAFEPLDPKSFKDQFELANKAHELISKYVCPDADPKKAQTPGEYLTEWKAKKDAAGQKRTMPQEGII